MAMSTFMMFFYVVVHFVVPIFDVVLLPEDVKVVLANFVVVLLMDDVDKVKGQGDADVFGFSHSSRRARLCQSTCVNFSRMSFSLV